MEAISSRKKPDKRTKGLSTPQRKERRLQQKRDYNKRLLNIGAEQHERWQSVRDRLGVKSDKEMARLLLDKFESTQQGAVVLTIVPPLQQSVDPGGGNDVSIAEYKALAEGPMKLEEQTATTSFDVPGRSQEVTCNGLLEFSDEPMPADCQGLKQINIKSEATAVGSSCDTVLEFSVIPPSVIDEHDISGDGANGDGPVGHQEDSLDEEDEEDWDSSSDDFWDSRDNDEYQPDDDSDRGSDSDAMPGSSVKEDEEKIPDKSINQEEEKPKSPELKKEEIAKEEVKQTESKKRKRRYRRRKQTWRDLDKSYQCQICSSQYYDAFSTCQHLLQAHPEVAGDLASYLKEKQAQNSKPGVTMYDLVNIEVPHHLVGDEQDTASNTEKGQETGSSGILGGEHGDARKDGGRDDARYSFGDVELVEFLTQWVKLNISCRYCKRDALRSGIFNIKYRKESIHMCRIVEDSDDSGTEENNSLCEVCGKSFAEDHIRKHHMNYAHSQERCPCHICGSMIKQANLKSHILLRHESPLDRFPCGICGKKFQTRFGREKHAVIHTEAKPHKCVYCPRRFTQVSNMKHHMRQHTGEKPYQCDKCKELFTHKVSLKNHLKKKHGIDLWKMGHTGGGRPKKQTSNNES